MERFVRSSLMLLAGAFLLLGFVQYCTFRLEAYKNLKIANSDVTLADRERQLECLAKNIYYEAGGEPFEGKVAVAQVTMNRAESSKFPGDICKVVYQKNVVYERVICQFSWYCDNATKIRPIRESVYNESYAVAKKVLLEGFMLDGLKEAMYYHADYVQPNWGKQKITKIGQHIFYKE